mmetsp:Transcript_14735/g.14158  ORF Transcript_14735/g.14158 Transcript_14735/m.14158 type:complete len:299 (+) Transcript_14735:201-1097(+)
MTSNPTYIHRKQKMNDVPNPLMKQYQPPDCPAEIERWHYPDTDYGLLGSFSSQKQKFLELDKVNKKLSLPRRLHKCKVEYLTDEDMHEERMRIAGKSNINGKKETEKIITPHTPLSSSRVLPKNMNIFNENTSTARTNDTVLTDTVRSDNVHTNKNLKKYKNPNRNTQTDMYNQKISTFKSLSGPHPEILADWRANRASGFVSTQKHPLEPPTQRELHLNQFKPPGLVSKTSSESNLLQKPKKVEKPLNFQTTEIPKIENSSHMKDDLDILVAQLEKTEKDMARQQLKISLRKKALYK